jgi:hypothetical protein
MGERKVLNKYFPPDFDPKLMPKGNKPKNGQIEVRMMLPFSIQCNTCGEYMYRGKKFNSKKEDVLDEDYHGIKIFRFYIRCVTCSSEITFKTDPEHGDYKAEHGCMRNFEPWRENDAEADKIQKEREEEEKGDSMKALENRTLDSKREMDILDALDEIKAINQRHAKVDTDALLAKVTQQANDNHDNADAILEEKEIQEEMEKFRKRKLESAPSVVQAKMAKTALGEPLQKMSTSTSTPFISLIKKKPIEEIVKIKASSLKSKPKTTKAPVALVSTYSDSSSDSS